MKKYLILILYSWIALASMAQETSNDSVFCGRFVNEKLKIFLVVNLYKKNITVPDQDILGELDGYMGSKQTAHVWAITSSDVQGHKATFEAINNYGSEDFSATLELQPDGSLLYHHEKGSTFKFPVNRKWQKIPSKVVFTREK